MFLLGFIVLITMWIVYNIRKRTRYGLEQTAWEAFKRFHFLFSNMDRGRDPIHCFWEHYLVYAISLEWLKK